MILTATQLQHESHLMATVSKEDIVITQEEKAFAVLVDIQRYEYLTKNQKDNSTQKKLDALKALGGYHLGGKDIRGIKADMYDNG